MTNHSSETLTNNLYPIPKMGRRWLRGRERVEALPPVESIELVAQRVFLPADLVKNEGSL